MFVIPPHKDAPPTNFYAVKQALARRADRVFDQPVEWRAFDGVTNCLIGSVCYELQGTEIVAGSSLVFFAGHAEDISSSGFRSSNPETQDYWVVNYPFLSSLVSDQAVSGSAKLVGKMTYTTVLGASRTILKLDFGRPCNPPAAYVAAKTEAARKAAAAQSEATQKKKAELGDKALKFNQEAADRGDAYGLFRMGERYRDGEGVERDLIKARDFFHRASQAGSSGAASALQNLPQS